MEEGLTSLSDTITCIVVISLLSAEVWNNETMFTNEGDYWLPSRGESAREVGGIQ